MDNTGKEKAQFEYLFLDIEWNQAPGTTEIDGREAIQIGIVAVDAEMHQLKTFSKAIKLSAPELFNEKTEKISHTPLSNIMQGKSEETVLNRHFPNTIILSYGQKILTSCSNEI